MRSLAVTVAFVLCASGSHAQTVANAPSSTTTPDFSGEWVLVTGIADSPLFRDGRIEQNARTLTFRTSSSPGGVYDEPRILFLDGSESFYTHTKRGATRRGCWRHACNVSLPLLKLRQ